MLRGLLEPFIAPGPLVVPDVLCSHPTLTTAVSAIATNSAE